MEYVWYTLLHRKDNFEETTPKIWFSQFDIYKKINNIEQKEEEKKTYIDFLL